MPSWWWHIFKRAGFGGSAAQLESERRHAAEELESLYRQRDLLNSIIAVQESKVQNIRAKQHAATVKPRRIYEYPLGNKIGDDRG